MSWSLTSDPHRQNVQIAKAREIADRWRALAKDGIDPRKPDEQPTASKLTYEVRRRPLHRDLREAAPTDLGPDRARVEEQLRHPPPSAHRRITKRDVRDLLRSFLADGHVYKAAVTRAWLKKFWRWAFEDYWSQRRSWTRFGIDYEQRERTRIFSDAEIKATWNATDKLDPIEGLRQAHDPPRPAQDGARVHVSIRFRRSRSAELWTTPFNLTKSRKTSNKKRVYLTPLPPLAQRIVSALLQAESDQATDILPTLPVHETKGGRPTFYGVELKSKLVEMGAPADFTFHAWRHTIATFLENEGHSEWERGLALNHSGSASVTAGYSHGDRGNQDRFRR